MNTLFEFNGLHNKITLRNKQAVVLNTLSGDIDDKHIHALITDIAQFGYTIDGDVISVLKTQSAVSFHAFYTMLVDELKDMVGANVKYRPLFKKFPDDIPDDDEYFIKRLVGFVTNLFDMVPEDVAPLSCGHVIDTRLFNMDDFGACPICQMQVDETTPATDRPALDEVTPFKVIGLATEEDVYQIFTNLLASKSSISAENKDVITALVAENGMFEYIPDMIPMKENIALIAGLLIKHTDEALPVLVKHIKTATDVLRLAAQLCEGDVSLAEPTKFKLSNKERRIIMGLLDAVNNPEEDMLRYRMQWIRLAHGLHIGAKRKRFPNAFKAVDTLRNRAETIETFNSQVEALVLTVKKGAEADAIVNGLLAKLGTRPGEFARRMDFLLTHVDTKKVIDKFKGLVEHLTTPMLLQLSSHFKTRTEVSPFRYFFPKGNVAKMQVIEDKRPTISKAVVNTIVRTIESELKARFSNLESLGNVLVDPMLANYLVPLAQRAASESLVTVARGSRIAFPDKKTIRMFLYWKETDCGRVDVDLSAVAYDNKWEYMEHISYTALSGVGSVHSGDIQSAPNGASEFIDFNIQAALDHGIRYVTMNVISYTGQPFSAFEAFAGVMGRDEPSSGEHYEPTTVEHKFDVAGNSGHNIPFVIDLKKRELIWTDLAVSSGVFNNVENSAGAIVMMSKAAEAMVDTKPTMMDLLQFHFDARAESVDTERNPDKEYDTVIDATMATDIDDILANWL